MYKISTIRELIDEYFSIQWCRENIVVPISLEPSLPPAKPIMKVAVGNITYLGTIGEFIQNKASKNGIQCQFIQEQQSEIQKIIDEASNERIFKSDGVENWNISDEDILTSLLNENEEVNNLSDFNFDFDDSEEVEIEDNLDLNIEMLGDQIQKAAATILINSRRTNASDIHVEPHEKFTRIRLRRDGVLQSYVSMPRRAGIKLIACLKNMAKMDIAERRACQDGKIRRKYENKLLEFRCSTAPGKYGEKMVLRYLNVDDNILNLDKLITNESIRKNFRKIVTQTNGIVIVSGPTGSGKSTTLAAILREKDNGELNIVTAEDPIEYDLGGDIQQFQVLREKGQTFENLLRTFLRQDPDVILIGETRDPETADSSMDAAETGHLVFTTLHANSAASSLTRLMDMEVPAYKLTTSLRAILAQRLVRKVCPSCSIERPIDLDGSVFTGIKQGYPVKIATTLSAEEKKKRKSEGTLCTRCLGTGYKGRVGIYELLIINRRISKAIRDELSTQEIQDMAISDGMMTLKKYGVSLIEQKETTVAELYRICNDENTN